MTNDNSPPQTATDAVLVKSDPELKAAPVVCGYDFNKGVDYPELLRSMLNTGFQASNLGKAIDIVNEMVTLIDQ